MDDVYETVVEAKACYEKNNEHSKARIWLARFSSRVLFYANILDVLCQHHPEYVSLAWGTFRLLFVVVMNQEELISQLAKAMCKIAEVLPRVELKALTYRTDTIKHHIESLYATIVKFFDRVIKWYQEGPAKHAWNAFWKPFRLRFQDLCDEIDEGARRVDKLAEALMQAEVKELLEMCRSFRLEQRNLSDVLLELKQIVITNHSVNAPLILNTHRNTCEIQLTQMLSFTSSTSLPNPETTLRYCRNVRQRRIKSRQSRGSVRTGSLTNEAYLFSWASNSDPSLLVLKGSPSTRDNTKDFATSTVELLISMNLPVIWAFRNQGCLESGEDKFIQILKYLTWQALQLDTSISQAISPSFNATLLHVTQTEADWFNILKLIFARLPRVFIVIDTELLSTSTTASASFAMFYSRMRRFIDLCKPTIVKVMLASYRQPSRNFVVLDPNITVALTGPTRCRVPSFSRRRGYGTDSPRDYFTRLRATLQQSFPAV